MDFDKSLQMLQSSGASELGLRKIENFISKSGNTIKKVKYKPGDRVIRAYDIEMRLPANPFSPEDPQFNIKNPWISNLSPETTVLSLKHYFTTHPEEFKAFCERMNFDSWDISTPDKLTEQDKKLFLNYRKPIHFSEQIQGFKLSAFGEWGRSFLSAAVIENGDAVKTDVGYQLYQLECAIAKERVEQRKEDCKEGGSYASKSDTDKKDYCKAPWKEMLVGNPYDKGVARCIDIPCTKAEAIKEEKDKEELIENGPAKFARYFSCNKMELDKISDWIGTQYDKNFNYILVTLYYPKKEDVSEEDAMMEAYSQRSFNPNPILKLPENFDEQYLKFRDNYEQYFSEKVMLKSVYEFSTIEDSRLLELYKTELYASDKIQYITEMTAKMYKGIISRIDASLCDTLTEKSLDGELKSGSKVTADDLIQSVEEDAGELGDIQKGAQALLDLGDDDDTEDIKVD